MDDLQRISGSGGSDLYPAGTYKAYSSGVATITLTGTEGTATISINGRSKVATFATDLATTAQNFVAANFGYYQEINVFLTTTGDTIICTKTPGTDLVVTIDGLVTDLDGSVAVTNSHGSDVATFTLTSATSHAGATALITVNGISKVATFDTSIEITSTAFVTANAAAYLSAGIVLTGTTTLIFTASATSKIIKPSIQTLHSDLTGTIARTGTRLSKPIYAFDVITAAVISSYKEKESNGFITPVYSKFLGQSLAAKTFVLFENPITEIVIDSGTVVFYFI